MAPKMHFTKGKRGREMTTKEILKDLQPVDVFRYFEEMSEIPRGSGNEKGISDYLVAFAKEHQLDYTQDEALNVIIRKPATRGYENSKTIVLQGHMDIVCEKNADVEHDFLKDPLKLRIVDDMVMATGTTLGADNGIAVAMGLAILASDEYEHPALELLVTTSEETGMDGAMALDPKHIKGRTLINIDSEEEGKFLVSCAGGVTAQVKIPIQMENIKEGQVGLHIQVTGLKGGHSGMEIDKGRGNATKLLGRILISLLEEQQIQLVSIEGGSKHNAIPRQADASFVVCKDHVADVEKIITEMNHIFKEELRTPDPMVEVKMDTISQLPAQVMTMDSTTRTIHYLYLVMDGMVSMSMDIQGLVESSLNLGVITQSADAVTFISSIRSSVRSKKKDLLERLTLTAKLQSGCVKAESDYPEWAYNPDSQIRPIFIEAYKKLYGTEPEISAIHAGLECGLFAEKFGDIDEISFGPNLYDVHTPNESMSIPSVQRSWKLLLEALKNCK